MFHTLGQTEYIERMFGPIWLPEPSIGTATHPNFQYVGNYCEAAYDNEYHCILVRRINDRGNVVMYAVDDFHADFSELPKHFWMLLPGVTLTNSVERSWFSNVLPLSARTVTV